METNTRKEYLNSTNYKVVWLLSAYRRLFDLNGVEFRARVFRHRRQSLDKYFVTLVDMGFEQLDMYEEMAYVRYVSRAMGYDVMKFYYVLRDASSRTALSVNTEFNNNVLMRALSNITIKMTE